MNMNGKFSSSGGSESHEAPVGHVEQTTVESSDADQLLLDYLIDSGFTWEESHRLAALREQLYEGPEMQERVRNDYRLHFVQWLYEHGEIGQ